MSESLRAARIDFSDPAAPRSLDYDDLYHARGGAFAQARHVFLAGNQLPQRWAQRPRFVILETGFGLGQNFLATWAAWRDDPQRCNRLWYLAIEKHPPTLQNLQRAHAACPEPALAQALHAAWPPLTPDLHSLSFAAGRVNLLLAFGDIQFWLPQWLAQVDAFYLDGFAPARNPAMWEPRVLQRLRHLASDGATASTWSSARLVRDGLADAGFAVERHPGFDAKRDMLVARFAPRYVLRTPPGRRMGAAGRVAIVGAGLAGAAVARALALQDIPTLLFDEGSAAGSGASGNPAGLLHGVVHAGDGRHARWHRAAALHAASVLRPLVGSGAAAGALNGLLRLEHSMALSDMQQLVAQLGLPMDYVQPLGHTEASQRAGVALANPAWFYPAGGWVDPTAVLRAWLRGDGIDVRWRCRVERLQRGAQGQWLLIDAQGHCLAQADQVVLANAHDAQRLAGSPGWPLRSSRGQVTQVDRAMASRLQLLLPVAGAGYALTLPNGELLCGATTDLGDSETRLRDSDHQRNLDSLAALTGQRLPVDAAALDGRVAWRLQTPDKLPLVGALPDATAVAGPRQDQARFIAREPGLFVLCALGSRGIAQSGLAGEVLASWINGAPMPVGGELLNAIDVARIDARAQRAVSRQQTEN